MILSTHTFTLEEQLAFSELSHDHNPVHKNSEFARRTLFGDVVVHGMHLVLRMLVEYDAQVRRLDSISRVTAKFPRPVTLHDTVAFFIKKDLPDEVTIETHVLGAVYASCTVSLCSNDVVPYTHEGGCVTSEPAPSPNVLGWSELTGISGRVPLGMSVARFKTLLCSGSIVPGASFQRWATVLLGSTHVIGMKCPGLHSIFTSFDLHLTSATEAKRLGSEMEYKVVECDARFHRVSLAVETDGIVGELVAFLRPTPKVQPSLATLAEMVRPDEFSGVSALVIGGSRGLGEVAAKILLGGGAEVFATFHRGQDEMERIAKEADCNRRRFCYSSLDVNNPEKGINTILESRFVPTHLFYFATPPIFAAKALPFTRDVSDQFLQFYVYAFEHILSRILTAHSQAPLSVYWPSTTALDSVVSGLVEYSVAKAAGEELCRHLRKNRKIKRLVTPRLPRIETDQTQSLHAIPAEAAENVMLGQLRDFIQT